MGVSQAVRIVLNTYSVPDPIDKVVKKASMDFCPYGSYFWDTNPGPEAGISETSPKCETCGWKLHLIESSQQLYQLDITTHFTE